MNSYFLRMLATARHLDPFIVTLALATGGVCGAGVINAIRDDMPTADVVLPSAIAVACAAALRVQWRAAARRARRQNRRR